MGRKYLLPLLMVLSLPMWAQTSPNGKFKIECGKERVKFVKCTSGESGVTLLDIYCGNPQVISRSRKKTVDYTMTLGKRKHCRNAFTEWKYLLSDGDTLTVRLYNDGMAWKKSGLSKIRFVMPKHHWLQKWTDCYEEFFSKDMEIATGGRYGYPALVEFADNCFGLLTESGITPDEAGTSMYACADGTFELVPDGPENGGWQTFIVGKASDVVESTLVTDNSAPSHYEDTSWVTPGVASWVYWAYNHGSNDYEIIKKYVDLAVVLKLPYVLIDAEWDDMKDGRTVEDAVAYAVNNGIKPMIWYNSSVGWVNGAPGPKFRLNKPQDREKEFAWCEKIGVTGVKIDFFSGDTNLNMKYMSELLEDAACHHLMVNSHGAPIPRGWQRTYPNLVSIEAVYGAEWYNNLPALTDRAACHNATIPFTRNVIGSMDYTPCAFSDSQHPHITTHAHELALTSLFESGIQHIADRPESLLAQPVAVRDYFSNLPAAWDETVLLGGYPGEYVAMARRKDNKWWISVINGTDKPIQNLKIDYSRIYSKKKHYKGKMFEDAPEGSSEKWRISEISYFPDTIDLMPRGGMTAVVEEY